MCARIKYQTKHLKQVLQAQPGDTVEISNGPRSHTRGYWDGFARYETIEEKWTSSGWRKGLIDASSYNEKGVEFSTNGKKIAVIYRDQLVRVVTRAAESSEEKAVHHRHPLLVEWPKS